MKLLKFVGKENLRKAQCVIDVFSILPVFSTYDFKHPSFDSTLNAEWQGYQHKIRPLHKKYRKVLTFHELYPFPLAPFKPYFLFLTGSLANHRYVVFRNLQLNVGTVYC